MNNLTTKRNLEMDVLKVLAMLAVITHHLIYNGLHFGDVISGKTNIRYAPLYTIACSALETFVIIGVNLFFLLSGYFTICFKPKKWINIITTVYFYSVIILLGGFLLGQYTSYNELVKDFLLSIYRYWFIEVYLMLMLVAPILNVLINNLDNHTAKWLLWIGMFIFCGYGFVTNSSYIGVQRGYTLIFAIFLYLIGGILGKNIIFNQMGKQSVTILIITWIINSILVIICVYKKAAYVNILLGYNNPLILIQSISFISWFKFLRIKPELIIAKISSGYSRNTLAVYILHSSNRVTTYYRNLPLECLVNGGYHYLALFLVIPYAIIIFLICTAIDKYIFARIVEKILNLAAIMPTRKK